MFPIAKFALSFRAISDYWSRKISPPASSNELLDILVSAWWLGELRGDSVKSRLELLKIMFTSTYRDDLEIWPAPDLDDTQLGESSLSLELHRAQIPDRRVPSL
jgi:hypothetical protein